MVERGVERGVVCVVVCVVERVVAQSCGQTNPSSRTWTDLSRGTRCGEESQYVLGVGHRGFSLVEVMTVVAIAGILGAVAVPGISTAVGRAQAIAELDRIEATLRDARNEARRRRVCVNVAAPSLDAGVGRALRVAVDIGCDGDFVDPGDSVGAALDIGELRFPDAAAGEGITFGPRGGLRDGSPALVEGRAADVSRLYRVLPAIGAVRRER